MCVCTCFAGYEFIVCCVYDRDVWLSWCFFFFPVLATVVVWAGRLTTVGVLCVCECKLLQVQRLCWWCDLIVGCVRVVLVCVYSVYAW